jgi:hypothetical protein
MNLMHNKKVGHTLNKRKERKPHILFENFGFCELGVSKVDDFIQKFVGDDEVVAERFLNQLGEVLLENLRPSTNRAGQEKQKRKENKTKDTHINETV